MRTIDKIITDVPPEIMRRGAPMGRHNVGSYEQLEKSGYAGRIYDCAVPLGCDGAYDKGGVYWGCSSPGKGMGQLRVSYTKDLTYINFYRL